MKGLVPLGERNVIEQIKHSVQPSLLSAGGVEPPTKFSRREGGLGRTFIFRGELLGKRGVTFLRRGGHNVYIKNN